ncbi:hypothetical protein MKX53_06800 [Psychrobacillus sp. FSL K6-4615]|uniref:hypothetical protein n=1 Tax=Psychrobacillus sp. FSL K6-4615 TaxID=2921551 RepID=UPI0030FBE60F
MKKYKTLLFVLIGIICLSILMFLIYLFLSFLGTLGQGEYKKYNSGVTIEVNNLNNESISNLKFTYGHAENFEFKEIGLIKHIEVGKTATLTGSSKDIYPNDLSMYMHYNLENGEKKSDALAYFSIQKPRKVVVIIDINQVGDMGEIGYKIKGFDGLGEFID